MSWSRFLGIKSDMEVPFDILLLYLVEAGFYFHSIYATIFMDEWKKDSVAMILHHILANALIIFSLCFRLVQCFRKFVESHLLKSVIRCQIVKL